MKLAFIQTDKIGNVIDIFDENFINKIDKENYIICSIDEAIKLSLLLNKTFSLTGYKEIDDYIKSKTKNYV